MRRTTVVAGVALIATFALTALPAPAESRVPVRQSAIDGSAFDILGVSATLTGSGTASAPAQEAIAGLDVALRSDGFLVPNARFAEPGRAPVTAPSTRPAVDQPEVAKGSGWKPPRYTLRGQATFYDNGTTAMRLPRGTVVVICMAGGCIERVVSDWGPTAPGRIVDLDRSDFFAICGCASWSGVEPVTVHVY